MTIYNGLKGQFAHSAWSFGAMAVFNPKVSNVLVIATRLRLYYWDGIVLPGEASGFDL
jgi:hypothetical protein